MVGSHECNFNFLSNICKENLQIHQMSQHRLSNKVLNTIVCYITVYGSHNVSCSADALRLPASWRVMNVGLNFFKVLGQNPCQKNVHIRIHLIN